MTTPWLFLPCGDVCCEEVAYPACDVCSDGEGPLSLQIVIDGWTADPGDLCGGNVPVDDMNGTFVTDSSGGCNYDTANGSGIPWAVFDQSGSDYRLWVYQRAGLDIPGAPLAYAVWRYNFGTTKPDCKALSGLVLTRLDGFPFSRVVCPYGTCDCYFTSATCTVTAV